MKKEEILERSKFENSRGDERTKEIERKANENAYLCIMCVYALFMVGVTIQKFMTGEAIVDTEVLFLVFIVSFVGRNYTKYIYEKKKEYLWATIISIVATICCILNILLKAVGFF